MASIIEKSSTLTSNPNNNNPANAVKSELLTQEQLNVHYNILTDVDPHISVSNFDKQYNKDYVNYIFSQDTNAANSNPSRVSVDGTFISALPHELEYWSSRLAAMDVSTLQSTINSAYKPSTSVCPVEINPMAQSFYVGADEFPNGCFISSIDLYFASKDTNIPVSIEIRPMVNGYPSSSIVVPGSQVTLRPLLVSTPESWTSSNTVDLSSIGDPTKFTFTNPVYLNPGEYAIVIRCNSTEYRVYTSQLSFPELGKTNVISKNTYIGSLFLSQNASTWTAEQTKDLCFIINRCKFDTGNINFNFISKPRPYNSKFDTIHLLGKAQSFGEFTNIGYTLTTKNLLGNTLNSNNPVLLNKDYEFKNRQIANTVGDVLVSTTMTNNDSSGSISPILNLERFGSVVIENIVTKYTNAASAAELLPTGGLSGSILVLNKYEPDSVRVSVSRPHGLSENDYIYIAGTNKYNGLFSIKNVEEYSFVIETNFLGEEFTGAWHYATSRYITKRVNLAENFDATGLTVYLDVNRRPGTKIEVYYKVLNVYDNISGGFDARPYIRMDQLNLTGSGVVVTGENDWTEDTYQALNIQYANYPNSRSVTAGDDGIITFSGVGLNVTQDIKPGMTINKISGAGTPGVNASVLSVDSLTQITANVNNQLTGEFIADFVDNNSQPQIFDNFRTFAIKVVMYSDNTSVVPKIRNLRAIATA